MDRYRPYERAGTAVSFPPSLKGDGKLEEADTFGVIGATIADNFDVKMPEGNHWNFYFRQFK